MPSKVLDHNSPVGKLSTLFPNFQQLGSLPPKIFWCSCHVHVRSYLRGKFNPRAIKCIFFGYYSIQKGFKCYHRVQRRDMWPFMLPLLRVILTLGITIFTGRAILEMKIIGGYWILRKLIRLLNLLLIFYYNPHLLQIMILPNSNSQVLTNL